MMRLKKPELDLGQFFTFVHQILDKDVDSFQNQPKVSKFDWRLNVHVYNMDDSLKNSNSVVKMFGGLSSRELSELDDFTRRLDKIFKAAHEGNIEALCDAEQSYVQYAIDSVIEQFCMK